MQCPNCKSQVEESQRFCAACGTMVATQEEAGPDPMLGQVLGGKYRVVRLLGEGGMGAVYEGEQTLGTTKRKVAVKTLHPHLSRDPKVKARFEREVGTIAELEHPNTIQVYDFGSSDAGILYLVMEFLQGRSLADLLEKDGPMQPERVAYIMEQVCGSLAEAHDRGIVHRDLKPDNVVLVERAGKKDFVKVLDFGIAKRAKEEDKNEQKLTQQGMVLGTPPYMSPEQFTGRPIDARSDIYSLAVMAYEMLTGRLPFRAETAWEWATQHMTQNPIPIESLAEGMRAPEAMRGAIRRALAKSPDDRFQSVREFSDAFIDTRDASLRPPTAQLGTPAAGRARTEMGAPLDVVAAFGPGAPAPAVTPGAMPGMQTPPGAMQGIPPQPGMLGAPAPYTPSAGNMAMPAPAAIPQPPGRSAGGGGSRGLILGIAGVIGLASVVAIGFAVKGGGSAPARPMPSSNTFPTDPTTVLSGTAPTDIAVPTTPPSSANALPPLTGGSSGAHPSSSGGAHPSSSGSGGGTHPSSSGSGGGAPGSSGGGSGGAPSSSGGGSGGTPSSSGAKTYDGPECQMARQLKASGQTKQAQSYALACIAKGGTP